MKKRNIALLIAGIVLAAVFGVASAGIGFFVAGLAPVIKLVLFDIAILSACVGAFDLVTLSASLTTGYVKRKNAEKQQANSLAKLALNQVAQKGLQNEKEIAKLNEKKLAKDLAKSMAYSADNKKSGMLGNKFGYGKTKNQVILENQKQAYETYSAYANVFGSSKKSKIASKKVLKTESKIQKEQNKNSSMSGSYEYVSSVHIPQLGKDVIDNRTGASLNNEESLNSFKSSVTSSDSLRRRYGTKYKQDYGYVASIENNQSSSIKDTYVKSNAESEMPLYELILLKDLQKEISEQSNLQNVFPLVLRKRHYLSDKRFQDRSVVISSNDELERRVNLLTKLQKGDKRVQVSGKNYINENYSYSDFASDVNELAD